jgi:hypothetical protein
VKERQDAEDAVLRTDLEELTDALDVRGDVEVALENALRLARRPAREDDRDRVIHPDLASSHPEPQERRGKQPGSGGVQELRELAVAVRQVLEVDQRRRHLDLQLLDEGARGDDRADLRLLEGRSDRLGGCRVVQVHDGLAEERRGQVDHSAGHGRRHE